ncbi:MAG: hypothetical protein AB1405_15105, partial [Bdellovibrionota bacterium]
GDIRKKQLVGGWRAGSFCVLFAALFFSPSAARACSTCRCGDPTLTLQGMEKPYENRIRLSTEILYRTETFGTAGVDEEEITEGRLHVGVAWTPSEYFSLGFLLPVVTKELEETSGARDEGTGLGDVEFSGKIYLFRDSPASPRHMAGILAGLRVPSAPEVESGGVPLTVDAQPGQGQWVPSAGAWYGYYNFPFLAYASVQGLFPSGTGFEQLDAGEALVGTLTGQYAFNYKFAVQLGLDSRWTQKNEFGGTPDPDSGGSLLALAPGVTWSPVEDLLVSVSGQIPVAKNLNGEQDEGPSVLGGIIYDL